MFLDFFYSINIVNYIGYFPLSYYTSFYEIRSGLLTRFSAIAEENNYYKNKFYRKRFNVDLDLDYHISLYLAKGFLREKIIGSISFFRFLIPDIFLFMELSRVLFH
jgi:hypothetical protein